MNEQIRIKLERFMNDEALSGTVYEVIRNSFLKAKGARDVQVMAAERLAVDKLEDAWKEMERYQTKNDEESPPKRVSGL